MSSYKSIWNHATMSFLDCDKVFYKKMSYHHFYIHLSSKPKANFSRGPKHTSITFKTHFYQYFSIRRLPTLDSIKSNALPFKKSTVPARQSFSKWPDYIKTCDTFPIAMRHVCRSIRLMQIFFWYALQEKKCSFILCFEAVFQSTHTFNTCDAYQKSFINIIPDRIVSNS